MAAPVWASPTVLDNCLGSPCTPLVIPAPGATDFTHVAFVPFETEHDAIFRTRFPALYDETACPKSAVNNFQTHYNLIAADETDARGYVLNRCGDYEVLWAQPLTVSDGQAPGPQGLAASNDAQAFFAVEERSGGVQNHAPSSIPAITTHISPCPHSVTVYDFVTGDALATAPGQGPVAVSPDDRQVLFWSLDDPTCLTVLFMFQPGGALRTCPARLLCGLPPPPSDVIALAIAGDSRYVAAAVDAVVVVFDAYSDMVAGTYTGHTNGPVRCLALSQQPPWSAVSAGTDDGDGNYDDARVHVWDLVSATQTFVLEPQDPSNDLADRGYTSVAFSYMVPAGPGQEYDYITASSPTCITSWSEPAPLLLPHTPLCARSRLALAVLPPDQCPLHRRVSDLVAAASNLPYGHVAMPAADALNWHMPLVDPPDHVLVTGARGTFLRKFSDKLPVPMSTPWDLPGNTCHGGASTTDSYMLAVPCGQEVKLALHLGDMALCPECHKTAFCSETGSCTCALSHKVDPALLLFPPKNQACGPSCPDVSGGGCDSTSLHGCIFADHCSCEPGQLGDGSITFPCISDTCPTPVPPTAVLPTIATQATSIPQTQGTSIPPTGMPAPDLPPTPTGQPPISLPTVLPTHLPAVPALSTPIPAVITTPSTMPDGPAPIIASAFPLTVPATLISSAVPLTVLPTFLPNLAVTSLPPGCIDCSVEGTPDPPVETIPDPPVAGKPDPPASSCQDPVLCCSTQVPGFPAELLSSGVCDLLRWAILLLLGLAGCCSLSVILYSLAQAGTLVLTVYTLPVHLQCLLIPHDVAAADSVDSEATVDAPEWAGASRAGDEAAVADLSNPVSANTLSTGQHPASVIAGTPAWPPGWPFGPLMMGGPAAGPASPFPALGSSPHPDLLALQSNVLSGPGVAGAPYLMPGSPFLQLGTATPSVDPGQSTTP
eukprot:gene7827-189_t